MDSNASRGSPLFFTQQSEVETQEVDSLPPSPSLLTQTPSQVFCFGTADVSLSQKEDNRTVATKNDSETQMSTPGHIVSTPKPEASNQKKASISSASSRDKGEVLLKMKKLRDVCASMSESFDSYEDAEEKQQSVVQFFEKAKRLATSALASQTTSSNYQPSESFDNFRALSQISQEIDKHSENIFQKVRQRPLSYTQPLPAKKRKLSTRNQDNAQSSSCPPIQNSTTSSDTPGRESCDILDNILSNWNSSFIYTQECFTGANAAYNLTEKEVSMLLTSPELLVEMAKSSLSLT